MAETSKPDNFEPTGPETAPGSNVPTPEYLDQNWKAIMQEAGRRTDQVTHEVLRNTIVQSLNEQGFNIDPNDQQNAEIMTNIDKKIWKSVETLAKKTIRKLYNAWITEEQYRGKTSLQIARSMAKREKHNRENVNIAVAKKGVQSPQDIDGKNILNYFPPARRNKFIEREFQRLASGTAEVMNDEPTDQDEGTSTNQTDRGLNANHFVKGFDPRKGTQVTTITPDLLRRNPPTGHPARIKEDPDAYVSLSSVPAALAQAGILLAPAEPTQTKAPSNPPAAPTQVENPVEPKGSTANQPAISVSDIQRRTSFLAQPQPKGTRQTMIPPSAAPITRPIAPAAPKVPNLSGATTQRLPAARHWENRFVSKMNKAWKKVTSAISSILPSAKTMKKVGKVGAAAAFVAGAGLAVYSGSQATQTNSETTPQNSSASTPGKPEASTATATTAAASTASPNTTATTPTEAKAVDAGTQAAPQNSAPAAQANAPEQAPEGSTFTIETDPDKNPGLKKLFTAIKDSAALIKSIGEVAAQTTATSADHVQLYKAFLEKGVQKYSQGANGQNYYFQGHLDVLNKFLSQNPNPTIAELKEAVKHSLNDRLLVNAVMEKVGTSAPTNKFHFDTKTDQNGDIQFNDQSNLEGFNDMRNRKLAIAKTLEATIKYFEEHPFTSDNFKVCALEFIERAKEIQPGLDKEAAEAKSKTFDPKKKSGAIKVFNLWKNSIEKGSDFRTPIHELMGKIIQVEGKTTQLETAPENDTTGPTFNNFNNTPEKLGILKHASFGPWQTISVDPEQVGKSGQSKQANSNLEQPQIEKLAQLERDLQIMQDRSRTPVDTVQTAASFKALDVLDKMAENRDVAERKSIQDRINEITKDELSRPASTAEKLMQARIDAITKDELSRPVSKAAEEASMQARINAITKDELSKPISRASKEALIQAQVDAITYDELSRPAAVEKAATPQPAPSVKDEFAQIDSGWDTIAQDHEIAAIDKGWNIGNENSAQEVPAATTPEPSVNDQLAAIDAGWDKMAA